MFKRFSHTKSSILFLIKVYLEITIITIIAFINIITIIAFIVILDT